MNFEDKITLKKPKGSDRYTATARQAKASLARGLKGVSETYGFELEQGDRRASVISTYRQGEVATVVYGMNGRLLTADQLAYELNN